MSEEEDIFDEDLVRELGLEPEDLQGPSVVKKRVNPAASSVAKASVNEADDVYKPKGNAQSQNNVETDTDHDEEALKNSVDEGHAEADLEFASEITKNIPVQIAAVIAKKSAKLKDILELSKGEIIEFKKLPQDPIDLVANGKLVAKAELVLVDGKIGARIVKLVK